MAHSFQRWVTKTLRKKLLAEGRDENQQALEDWYACWKDALARGEDIAESPPNGTG